MAGELLLPALVGLLPVLSFLAVLLALDSYKLVRLRVVMGAVAAGAIVALAGYFVNGRILEWVALDFHAFTRYVSPATEELLKALVIVALVRAHRVGFLVDAAIFGFAVGAGFAAVENLHYLRAFPEAGMGTWVVRGFGTALMHGGATAIFGVMGLAMTDRARGAGLAAFLPGLAVAVVLHSAFNHLLQSPKMATLGIMVFYGVSLIMRLFGAEVPFLNDAFDTTPLAIGRSRFTGWIRSASTSMRSLMV